MSKILVVDDSQTELFSLKELLGKQGYQVIWATNGKDAIVIAEQEKPDLILMDVIMPELNGFQATRKLQKNPLTKHIPVIMITTKNQDADKIWGLRQGAREYLTKPLDTKQLLKTVSNFL